MFVLRRDAHVVYSNHLQPDNQWSSPAGTTQAITTERNRPRTTEETYRFAHSVREIAELAATLPEPTQATTTSELQTIQTLARPLLAP